jgi:hypothetical protein
VADRDEYQCGGAVKSSVYLILGGAAIASLLLVGSFAYDRHLKEKLADLERLCVQEEKATPNTFEDAGMCTGVELSLTSLPVNGLKAQIIETYEAKETAYALGGWGIGIFALSTLPFLWYFILRRIAELRRAVSGNAPDR